MPDFAFADLHDRHPIVLFMPVCSGIAAFFAWCVGGQLGFSARALRVAPQRALQGVIHGVMQAVVHGVVHGVVSTWVTPQGCADEPPDAAPPPTPGLAT